MSYDVGQIGGKVTYRGMQIFDRDIAAEKARAMLRKDVSVSEVTKALGYANESTVRSLAREYGFGDLVEIRSPRWPAKDDPGDATPSWRPKVKARGRRTPPPAPAPVVFLPAFLPKREPLPEVVPPPAEAAFGPGKEPKPFSSAEILRQVAWKHHSNVAEIISPVRSKVVVLARHEAMYRLRTERHLSWGQIGKMMNRDHTTALHGYRVHKARLGGGQ